MERSLFEKYEKPLKQTRNVRSERDEQIQKFVDKGIKVWADRKKTQLRDASASDIARKIAHIPTSDLHAFYKLCENARSFNRYFEWAIKAPKKTN
jgi:hypothetical protein